MEAILLGICAVICVAALVIVGFVAGIYNSLTKLKVLVEEAWSGIDVQLKKRYDLIPNLVNTVKGYATHEKELLENVTKYRSAAMGAQTREEQVEAENMLTSTLKTLFAVSENYPNLKADASFLNLQAKLGEVEGDLERARRYYNGTVRDFNTSVRTFPTNIIAGMLSFKPEPFFEAEAESRENVKVDFSK
jgi:LemA protein